MSNPDLNSLDDFQRFVNDTIKPWSREQRIALAAGMAERWLPVYASFSEQEDWGDPETFQRAVESVWKCVLGQTLSSKNHRQHKEGVDENTPHLDDFDAEEVIALSGMIDYALDCCVSTDNTDDAVMALVSGFEGVAPGIYTDAGDDVWQSPQVKEQIISELRSSIDNAPPIDEQELDAFRQQFMSLNVATDEGIGPLPADVWQSPQIQDQMEKTLQLLKGLSNLTPIDAQQIEALRDESRSSETEQAAMNVWQLPQVQNELAKQLQLIKLIGDMVKIDQQQINALRQKLTSPELAGSPVTRASCASGLTNEAVFERYRAEADGFLTDKEMWKAAEEIFENTDEMATPYFRAWAFRYSRRKRAIEERPMMDEVAHKAMRARHSTHDVAVQGDPGWSNDDRACIERLYQMDFEFDFDVKSPDKQHSYGPSLRRLCVERKLAGGSQKDVWESVLDWACHRPRAWDDEDQRKKKGLAHNPTQLTEHLARKLSWRATNDVDHPWTTEVAGETWRVRLNDFPDELMYTLIINDVVAGSFNEWPESWDR